MSLSICQRYTCEKCSTISCNICGIVKYCSEECMRNDLPGHSILCRADYSQMLRAYSEHLQTCTTLFTASISYKLGVKSDKARYLVGLNREFFCVCCKKSGLADRDDNDIHLEKNVYYGRCEECYDSDVRLCANSYLDAKLCWRGLKSLMLLREYIIGSVNVDLEIPYDIFVYIIGIASDVACHEHIFR